MPARFSSGAPRPDGGPRLAERARPDGAGRFSSGALRVLQAAEREARALRHGGVGSDHLLLGVLCAGDGVAATALSSLGVSLDAGRAQLELMSGRGIQPPGFSRLPLTADAARALRAAAGQARRGRPPVIGSEHILFGALKDRGAAAVRLLARLGVSPPAVRDRYVQLAGLTGAAARIRVVPGPRADQFSDGARRALGRAEDEARMLGHRHVGTEDLLLGLISAAGEPAAAALAWMGVTDEAVREQAIRAVGQEPRPLLPSGSVPYAPDARQVMDASLREARRNRRAQVGSEHLLRALLRDDGSLAVHILRKLGADPAAVRQRLTN